MVLIAAFVAGLVAVPVAAAVATRTGLVDHPGPLKVHARAVPYLGGLAVVSAAAPFAVANRAAVLAPVVLALALGTADDAVTLSPRLRLAATGAIGLVAAGVAPGDAAVKVVAAVAVVVMVNAVNLIDGLDALAGSVAAASLGGFALVLSGPDRAVAMSLLGAVGAFLLWNRPPARIYLGDGGSYALGAALGMLTAACFASDGSAAASSALLVAVPVGEVLVAVARRVRAHRPLFEGDRAHVYDQLVQRGHTPTAAVATCAAAQLAFAGVAVSVRHAAPATSAGVVAAAIAATAVLLLARGFVSPAYATSAT